MPKVKSYEDKKYIRTADLYPMIEQSHQDIRHERSGTHGWNKPVHEMEGVTLRHLGGNRVQITYMRYEMMTREQILRQEGDGFKLVDEYVKELKKKFRENTKKAINFKKVKDSQNESYEKVSAIFAPTSRFGSFNQTNRPVSRILIRNTVVYDFDTSLGE
jgi:hypothetical protein